MITVPISRQIAKYILAQVQTITGLPAAQAHSLETTQIDTAQLPDVCLFTVEDKPHAEAEVDSAGGQIRALTFAVAITALSLDEAATDTLAMRVRQAVLQDAYLGGLAMDVDWISQEWGEGATAEPTVSTKLTFTARYNWSPEW